MKGEFSLNNGTHGDNTYTFERNKNGRKISNLQVGIFNSKGEKLEADNNPGFYNWLKNEGIKNIKELPKEIEDLRKKVKNGEIKDDKKLDEELKSIGKKLDHNNPKYFGGIS